jgi:hypothetical protein
VQPTVSPLIFVLVFTHSLILPPESRAELVHGFADLCDGGFDFSNQESTVGGDADVELYNIFEPPLGWRIVGFQPHAIAVVPGSTLEIVTEAPSDTTMYWDMREVFLGTTYVVRTVDGFYAKFQITDWQPWLAANFEYYVQMDGSRNLDSSVPVYPTTWGRLKAMYSR